MTDRRNVFIILPSNTAKKLTPGLICLIVNQTVPLKVNTNKHNHEKWSKHHERLDKDQVRMDKPQTRKVRNWHIISMNITYLTGWVYVPYLGWIGFTRKEVKFKIKNDKLEAPCTLEPQLNKLHTYQLVLGVFIFRYINKIIIKTKNPRDHKYISKHA